MPNRSNTDNNLFSESSDSENQIVEFSDSESSDSEIDEVNPPSTASSESSDNNNMAQVPNIQNDLQHLTTAIQRLGTRNLNPLIAAVNNLQQNVTQHDNNLIAHGNIINAQGRYAATPPTFSGGKQDPMRWLADFNAAANANGWNAAHKLAAVRAYSRHWI